MTPSCPFPANRRAWGASTSPTTSTPR
jgi:hypothetical protein